MFFALALLLPSLLGLTPAPGTATLQEPVARESFDHTHAQWSRILAAHVRADRFDYAAAQRDPAPLVAYLARLEAVGLEEFRGWSREQRFAFWINAYNAHTVRRVVQAYPVKSIRDLGSLANPVWQQCFIPLAHLAPELEREQLSLDDIEHALLRPTFKDARIHAALNCASVGCPRLLDHAYTAGVLEQQLDQATVRWLAEPERNRFDAQTRSAYLSSIFDWYGNDFGLTPAERLSWIVRYAPREHRSWLADPERVQIRYLEYDWSLNDAPSEARER